MELKEFITQTLRDIVTGIKEAQESKDIGESVAPNSIGKIPFSPESGVFMTKNSSSVATVVRFDVAVTAESEKSGKGEGKVRVFGFGGGVEGQLRSKDTTLSRIQFSVPVVLGRLRI
jgi:hypothetical protein